MKMDAQKYGRLTSSPLFVRRATIEETIALVNRKPGDPADALNRLLHSDPLPKPEGHTGDSATDYLDTSGLGDELLSLILDYLIDAEADAALRPESSIPSATKIALLVDLWNDRRNVDVTPVATNSEQGGAAKPYPR